MTRGLGGKPTHSFVLRPSRGQNTFKNPTGALPMCIQSQVRAQVKFVPSESNSHTTNCSCEQISLQMNYKELNSMYFFSKS